MRPQDLGIGKLFDNVRDAVIVADVFTGRIILWNPAATEIFGYTTSEALGGLGVEALVPERLKERHRARLSRYRETGHGAYVDSRAVLDLPAVRKGGEEIRVELTLSPIKPLSEKEAEGRRLVLAVVRDVTERKGAEQALKENEHRLQVLFENSSDLISIVNPDNTVRYIGPSVKRLLGYEPEELEGALVSDLVHPEDYERFGRRMVEQVQSGIGLSRPIEARYRHKDGSWRYLETTCNVLIEDPKVRGVVCASRDVTERKRAEEAIRESERRYRSVVDNVNEVVFQTDASGLWTFLNRAWEEITGFPVEESVGKNFLDYVHPDDRQRNLELFRPLVERKKDYCRHEIRYLTRDGGSRWIEVWARLTLGDDETIAGTSGTLTDITERKESEDAIKESEWRFRQLFERSVDALLVHDEEGRILDCNGEACRSLGYSRQEMLSLSVKDFATNLASAEEQALRKLMLWQRTEAREIGTISTGSHLAQHRRKDGTAFPVEVRVGYVDFGGKRRMLAAARDITETKRAAEGLLRSERELAGAQRLAHVGSWSFDTVRDEGRWSDEMFRIFGFAPQEFVVTYKRFLKLVHREDRNLVRRMTREALRGSKNPSSLDYRLVRPDGEVRFLHSEYEVVLDGSGRPVRLVGTSQDVTERKVLEKKLTHQALHDPLTGLPNRALLLDRLERALSRANRREGTEVAVLFMDLDNFKFVNDTLGHRVGDDLLVAVSGRLRSCLRPEDTAARLGGDEFAVLLEDVEDPGEATQVAERVTEVLRAPFIVSAREVFVTPSIGIALSGSSEGPSENLMRDADMAMYRAKEEGKARYKLFDPGMECRITARMTLENDLRRGIERDEFEVYYQPVVALDTGRTVGMEALVRWQHPERGLVAPSEFVPLAEEIGLIVPIGRRVLREACRQAREWQELYPSVPSDPPLVIGVNLSARQLRYPGLLEDVEGALRESGLDPRWLILEITESVVVGEGESRVGILRELREQGVRFALDDFGTGYSSLSYLKHLPVGMLKIDRSFVERIGEDAEDAVLIAGVVGIAHGLGLRVLAEGVETAEQLERVKALGCELAQGYHFARPMPSGKAEAFLASRRDSE